MVASVSETSATQSAIFTLTVIAGRPRLEADHLAGMITALTGVLASTADKSGKVAPALGISNLLSGFSEYADNQRLAIELSMESRGEPLVRQTFAWLEALRGFKYIELLAPRQFLVEARSLARYVGKGHVQEMWLSRTGGASVHITADTYEHANELLSPQAADEKW